MPQPAHVLSAQPEKVLASPNNAATENLLTVSEVARQLRVDTTTVRRWIVSGTLEAVILPHRGNRHGYRIRQSTLNQIIQPSASPES
jgi:excisionase family DNA binding protein